MVWAHLKFRPGTNPQFLCTNPKYCLIHNQAQLPIRSQLVCLVKNQVLNDDERPGTKE